MRIRSGPSRRAMPLALATVLALAVPAAAQHPAGHGAQGEAHGVASDAVANPTTGLRAELLQDVEQLEQKYLGLAEAMAGKYGWRPAEGVRSVGEVFGHVAAANLVLPGMAGVEPPELVKAATMQETMGKARALEKEADEAKVREVLKESFAHVKQAIASTPDEQLDASTKLFGRDATNRAVLLLVVTHMHEHLGQSIAYARTNGVVPPWSADN